MDPREELSALRRMAELEDKAGASSVPQQEVSTIAAPLITLGRGVDKLAAGARQAVGSIPGIGPTIMGGMDKLNDMLGMGQVPSIDPKVQQDLDQRMSAVREQHPIGAFAGDVATSALAGANPLGMALVGGLEYGTPGERAMRAGLGYAGGKVGEKVAGKIADTLSPKAVAPTVRDATVREAQSAGYVFPPSQVNQQAPGLLNRLAEGFAGKLTTAQQAAIKNQETTNRLAKLSVGLDAGADLTPKTLSTIRAEAGKAYEAVRGVGTVQADEQFGAKLGEIVGPYLQTVGQFPSRRNPAIDALLKDVTQPQMESGAIVDLVKDLRFNGFRNVKSPDPMTASLGKVEIGAQNALEDLMERNLQAAGNDSLLAQYKAARILIAKTHTVENALEESTGKVIASKVGREFSKGRPLTGELATIGKTAEAFPKALQNVNSSMPGLSPLDYSGGVLGGVLSGNPAVAALPLLRPALRSAMLTPAWQKLLASPNPRGLLNLSPKLRDLIEQGGGLLGGSGAMNAQ